MSFALSFSKIFVNWFTNLRFDIIFKVLYNYSSVFSVRRRRKKSNQWSVCLQWWVLNFLLQYFQIYLLLLSSRKEIIHQFSISLETVVMGGKARLEVSCFQRKAVSNLAYGLWLRRLPLWLSRHVFLPKFQYCPYELRLCDLWPP